MGLTFAINLSIELSFQLNLKGAIYFMCKILFVILGQVGICGVRILTNI